MLLCLEYVSVKMTAIIERGDVTAWTYKPSWVVSIHENRTPFQVGVRPAVPVVPSIWVGSLANRP